MKAGRERGEEEGNGKNKGAYTSTELTDTLALGVLGAIRSVEAIKAATTKMTVVRKPKAFWTRTVLECMVGGHLGRLFNY